MPDAADIERLRAEFQTALAAAPRDQALRAVRDRFLARKGGDRRDPHEGRGRRPAGRRPLLGTARQPAQDRDRSAARRDAGGARSRPPVAGAVDITLPGRQAPLGHLHPLTAVRNQVEAIFSRMGYEILEGPEIEDDYHNFEALNMPPEHPARDMQDTLFLARPVPQRAAGATGTRPSTGPSPPTGRPRCCARTPRRCRFATWRPTSRPSGSSRLGKVFRRDNLDLTHTPMFQQFEGLLVDEGVTMADLKGTLTAFLREVFAPDTKVIFRPSFFPYTEPSAEVFIGCVFCGGSGCPVCKRTGWLEILGSGMVHPAVLEAVGYDPERYTGFAFGIGHRARRDAEVRRGRHQVCSTRTTCVSWSSSPFENPRLVAP